MGCLGEVVDSKGQDYWLEAQSPQWLGIVDKQLDYIDNIVLLKGNVGGVSLCMKNWRKKSIK
jgi:hypothetical protein